MPHDPTSALAPALFGWNPAVVALTLFIGSYLLIMSERVNRAIVALLGASLMILTGILNQEAAVAGVDFNTIGLLLGMMVIVGITQKSGVFQYVAIWSAKRVRAHPWGVLLMLSGVTALFSALLDNVTTVLLIAPVTLLIAEELQIHPYPLLFSEIFASNIGGTATLIGDPPNIMIGSAAGLTFNDFLLHLAPISLVILLAMLVPIYFIWGRRLQASPERRARVMAFREREAIQDVRLLKQAGFVLALVILGFLAHGLLGLEPATIAVFGAALLLLLSNWGKRGEEQSEAVQHAFSQAEWVTLFFFVGLFILVAGVERTGMLELLAQKTLSLTGGELGATALTILWVSALASAFIDNIPFVATMIPLIKGMGGVFTPTQLEVLWWSLALGACLGGNGTLIGASANLVVAGMAERVGYGFRFLDFLKVAFPLMLLSIGIATIYVYLRYL
ncbi:MAG: ArsB/NhaD family transporter [Pseudomonadota bacterium]